MRLSYKKYRLAATTALVLFGAQPVFAQDGKNTQNVGEDDAGNIIVTARRVEERLQSVPISISVISQKELGDRNILSTRELANYTPALQVNQIFGYDNVEFSIRGFSQLPYSTPAVGVSLGDVIAPRGASSLSSGNGGGPGFLFDLQNVQVLKGPQGTLQGRNTTGGAILLVPHKPEAEFGGYVEASLGTYDLFRVQGAVNTPLGDSARLRLSIDRMKRNGYIHNISDVGPKNFMEVNYLALRGSLVVDLSPDIENYTIVSYSRSRTSGSTGKLIACNPASGSYAFCVAQMAKEAATGDRFAVTNAMPDARSHVDMWSVINTTTWTVNDNLKVKNIFSYAELKNSFRTSLYGIGYDISALPLPVPVTQPVSVTNVGERAGIPLNHQSTLVEELRLEGTAADGRLTWQGGLYFELSSPLSERTGSNTSAGPVCVSLENLQCRRALTTFVSVNGQATTYRDMAIYGQASYAFSDQWKLTAGLRYTDDITRVTGESYLYNFDYFGGSTRTCTSAGATPASCTVSDRSRTSAPTWLIGLDYTPNSDVLIYGKYARGYRQGSSNLSFEAPNKSYGAEKLDSFEVGAKTSWSGNMPGYLNVAMHYNELSQQHILLSFTRLLVGGGSGGNSSAVCACARSRIYGAEVDGAINLFDGFKLSASYAYLNTRIKGISNLIPLPDAVPGLYTWALRDQVLEGAELTLSPHHKLTATAAYTLPLPEDTLGKMTLSATLTHSSSLYNSVGSPVAAKTRALTLLNLNLNWANVASLPMDLSLFVTNVTNKYHYLYISNIYDGVGVYPAALGEPRMFGARVKYRF